MSVGIEISALRALPVIRKHVDGPVLQWAGRMHWLTLRERFAVAIGRETAISLARKHFGKP